MPYISCCKLLLPLACGFASVAVVVLLHSSFGCPIALATWSNAPAASGVLGASSLGAHFLRGWAMHLIITQLCVAPAAFNICTECCNSLSLPLSRSVSSTLAGSGCRSQNKWPTHRQSGCRRKRMFGCYTLCVTAVSVAVCVCACAA